MQRQYYLYIFLLFSVSFMMVGSVSAMGEYQSPTPTRDYRTPPPTPTPYNSLIEELNFDCPAGVPEGYGEVVPDPAWLATCGQCLPSPTPVATFSDWGADGQLILLGGDMQSATGADGHQYFWSFSDTPATTRSYMWTDQEGVGTFRSMFVTIRFAGYDTFNLYANDLPPAYFNIVFDGLVIGSIPFPLDQLPNEYEFQFDLEEGRENSSTMSFVLADFPDDTEGDPQYLHQWGCTRIYITSEDETGTFEQFTCPLLVSGGGECDFGVSDRDITNIVVYTDGPDQLNVTANEVTCVEYGYGLKCDFFQSVDAPNENYAFGRVGASVNFDDTSGLHDFYVVGYFNAPDIYGYDGPYIEFGSGIVPAGSFADGSSPAVGIGNYSVDEYISVFNNVGNLHYVTFGLTSWGEAYASFSGTFYISPVPVVICDENIVEGTPIPINQPLTGNYCVQVLPFDPSLTYDFDIVEEGLRECIEVPYVSMYDFIPDWAVPFIAPDFAAYIQSWLSFPASTFCYYTVGFEMQYILNVPINIELIASIVLVIWVLVRITSE